MNRSLLVIILLLHIFLKVIHICMFSVLLIFAPSFIIFWKLQEMIKNASLLKSIMGNVYAFFLFLFFHYWVRCLRKVIVNGVFVFLCTSRSGRFNKGVVVGQAVLFGFWALLNWCTWERCDKSKTARMFQNFFLLLKIYSDICKFCRETRIERFHSWWKFCWNIDNWI